MTTLQSRRPAPRRNPNTGIAVSPEARHPSTGLSGVAVWGEAHGGKPVQRVLIQGVMGFLRTDEYGRPDLSGPVGALCPHCEAVLFGADEAALAVAGRRHTRMFHSH